MDTAAGVQPPEYNTDADNQGPRDDDHDDKDAFFPRLNKPEK